MNPMGELIFALIIGGLVGLVSAVFIDNLWLAVGTGLAAAVITGAIAFIPVRFGGRNK